MRPAIPIAVACALALVACSTPPADAERAVAGTTWSATDIYLAPGARSALPASSAGAVTLVFGADSATGNTGCAPLQADITLEDDRVTFDDVSYGEVSPTCPEPSREVHDDLTGLIRGGAQFDIDRRGPSEIMLTEVTEAVDRPSIRLLAL